MADPEKIKTEVLDYWMYVGDKYDGHMGLFELNEYLDRVYSQYYVRNDLTDAYVQNLLNVYSSIPGPDTLTIEEFKELMLDLFGALDAKYRP